MLHANAIDGALEEQRNNIQTSGNGIVWFLLFTATNLPSKWQGIVFYDLLVATINYLMFLDEFPP